MIYKYKLRCTTEDTDKEWYLQNTDPAPTKCPTDTDHGVDLSTLTVTQIGRQEGLYNNEGNQIVAPTFEDDGGLMGVWKGFLYTATAGVLNLYDEVVTKELKLRGGWYELIAPQAVPQAAEGDYIEFSIVDKDDILGMFGMLGLTVGVDVLELAKFVRKDYVNPYETSRQEFMSMGASAVMQGLYFRTAYQSTGATNVKFTIVLKYHEVP